MAASLNSPGWLVLTDTYYPGWQASVDGQPADIAQVNVMFRAVALPAGQHRVVFEFKPRSVQMGAWISGLALTGVIAALTILVLGHKYTSISYRCLANLPIHL
jgi:uncharacterized membrane protein YfhO